jgi:hypothetical protein
MNRNSNRYIHITPMLTVASLAASTFAGDLTYTINPQNVTGEWTHFFENCVGSGHASLALRADYQQQMRRTRADIGFKQVRFHGLFIDDMSVVLPAEGGAWM